jgi:hypothetical protein
MDNQKKAEQKIAYIFGIVFIVVTLFLAIAFPEPALFQYTVFRIVLALAAAGIASVIPGFLNVEVGAWVRASGAIAIFVIVYFFTPAQLAVKEIPVPKNEWIIVSQNADTLPEAIGHSTDIKRLGYQNVYIYKRDNKFRNVIQFDSQQDAEKHLPNILKNYNDTAHVEELQLWCPNLQKGEDYFICP